MIRELSPAAKAELGARRCRYRRRIQETMDRHGIHYAASLARELGISEASVYRTLAGTLHTGVVLDRLREMGVPEEFLCDPRRAVGTGGMCRSEI